MTIQAVESHSAGDYIPNFATLARQHYDVIVGAGFLLADAENTVAKKFPTIQFAITDYSVHGAPFADKKGNVLTKNVTGLTYATQENSYLVGCLSALMTKKDGAKHIDQRDRRRQDPAGRLVHRRVQGRRAEVRPGHEGAGRLLADLHRAGQVQGDRAEPDRRGLARSSSRSPAPVAWARSRRRRSRRSGATASTSTRRTSARTS